MGIRGHSRFPISFRCYFLTYGCQRSYPLAHTESDFDTEETRECVVYKLMNVCIAWDCSNPPLCALYFPAAAFTRKYL